MFFLICCTRVHLSDTFFASRTVVPVYPTIQNLTVGTPATSDGIILSDRLAPLFRSIRLNDFFKDEYNDAKHGLLAAELWFPDAPMDIRSDASRRFEIRDVVSEALSPRDSFVDGTFWKKESPSSYPCITVQQAAAARRLVQCAPDASTPQFLTRTYCDSVHAQILQAINQYARRIESNGVPFPSTRYPPASTGYVCLWDCGYEGSNVDKGPVHLGLNASEIRDLQRMANNSLLKCYSHADLKEGQQGRMCFREPSGTDLLKGMLEISQDDLTGTYTQEVCGELIKESHMAFLGDPGKVIGPSAAGGVLGVIAAGIGYAVVRHADQGVGIESTMENMFNSYREVKYGRPYNCSQVQVQSSGNEVVDRVRAGLSFNDIKARAKFPLAVSDMLLAGAYILGSSAGEPQQHPACRRKGQEPRRFQQVPDAGVQPAEQRCAKDNL